MLKHRQRMPIRDHRQETALFFRRAAITLAGMFALLLLLLSNLFHLQVSSFEDYQTRSNDNRIQVLPIAPNRGLIYDRNGVLLAENRPVYSLEIIPEQMTDVDAGVAELQQLLGLDPQEVEQFHKRRQYQRRFKPVVLAANLSEQQVARFAAHQHRFAGASIEAHLKRYYPYADSLTHMLGYVARINDRDLDSLDRQGKAANYAATRDIGKQGVERYYEELLHGKVGYQKVEVNSRGRIIRTLSYQPPEPGKDLYLNIDINLQLRAQTLLEGQRGAIVLLDPRDGAILALVSSPSYDPNLFVHGISGTDYNELLSDKDHPLINRATQGTYPPASTIKPIMALLGLNEGTITRTSRLFDPGWFQIPNTKRRFRDWKHWGHGWVNVYKAIEQSVDTYFYNLAYETGIDKISGFMHQFGFGDYTGIDIHEESRAIMPSREWKQARYRQPWYQGDTISIGIGQGYWTSTPLQLAHSISILTNRGANYTPRLLRAIRSPSGTLPMPPDSRPPVALKDPAFWQVALDGMHGVTSKTNGTAYKVFHDAAYSVAGKSGTAQVVSLAEDEEYDADKLDERHRDNAMFVAFAPFESPQLVAAVVVENAGGGSSHAAPIVRRLFDAYFVKEYNNIENIASQ